MLTWMLIDTKKVEPHVVADLERDKRHFTDPTTGFLAVPVESSLNSTAYAVLFNKGVPYEAIRKTQ